MTIFPVLILLLRSPRLPMIYNANQLRLSTIYIETILAYAKLSEIPVCRSTHLL